MRTPLIERGQQAGTVRVDVPVSWHLSMLLALIHAASGELRAKHLLVEQVEAASVAPSSARWRHSHESG